MSGGNPLSVVAISYMYVCAKVVCTPLLLIAAKDEAKSLHHMPRTWSTTTRASLTVGRGGGVPVGWWWGSGVVLLLWGAPGPNSRAIHCGAPARAKMRRAATTA